MGIFKECADIKTSDMAQLEKPKAIVEDVVAKPSKVQKKYIKSLGHRAAMIRNGGIDPRIDNTLRVVRC